MGVARVNGDLAVSRAFGDAQHKTTGGANWKNSVEHWSWICYRIYIDIYRTQFDCIILYHTVSNSYFRIPNRFPIDNSAILNGSFITWPLARKTAICIAWCSKQNIQSAYATHVSEWSAYVSVVIIAYYRVVSCCIHFSIFRNCDTRALQVRNHRITQCALHQNWRRSFASANSLVEVKLSFHSLHILSFGAFIAVLFVALLAPAKEFECAPTDFLMLVCDGISEGAQTTYAERIQAV